MTLEEFEKSLREGRAAGSLEYPRESQASEKDRHRHRHLHHRRHHRSPHHRTSEKDDERRHHHRHKRPRTSEGDEQGEEVESDTKRSRRHEDKPGRGEMQAPLTVEHGATSDTQRDAWMQAPSALDFDIVNRPSHQPPERQAAGSARPDFELKVHKNELNHHLRDLADGLDVDDLPDEPASHEVDYTFGDAGSHWRMTKLQGVLRQAEESGRAVEDVAIERFGDLQAFDNAREEQTELGRRETYGRGYLGKEKPTGELYQQREREAGPRQQEASDRLADAKVELPQGEVLETTKRTVSMDQTGLNRLRAQMMKAKLRGSSDLPRLEAEYAQAESALASKGPQVVVLDKMENRLMAGGRQGEIKEVETKRGRERGLVEENEDMSLDDMVREERRTRGQAGGEATRFAERIAKDGKFDNDLDYMDENANKLAKRVQKSEINLRNMAINDFQKMNRILDTCPLCHHEDKDLPPVAPLVSLGTRVYLTLPTEPEISEGGACIVPIQHRGNLLECDDDEWEEIRNFMKSLTRMYHDQGRDVIFYENAAAPQKKRHAAMEVVPLPYSLGETAPAFFKEAILTSDEEWTQHAKIIDTLQRAQKQGLGKQAFRRSLAKEMPYFHVWFAIDGGLGHIVEDSNRWPKGDLFAREVLGGMLDVDASVIKRRGRWAKGTDARLPDFKKRWRKFDWTRVLTDH
ncbi:MAG: hypothetical protein M1838_000645 [Thelocarpon superellum]|nr:MAG: hypothetical protein M1838_000645 [Thelocarpon superellum]